MPFKAGNRLIHDFQNVLNSKKIIFFLKGGFASFSENDFTEREISVSSGLF